MERIEDRIQKRKGGCEQHKLTHSFCSSWRVLIEKKNAGDVRDGSAKNDMKDFK